MSRPAPTQMPGSTTTRSTADAGVGVDRHRVDADAGVGVDRHQVDADTEGGVDRHRVDADAEAGVDRRQVDADAGVGVDRHQVDADTEAGVDRHQVDADTEAGVDRHRVIAESGRSGAAVRRLVRPKRQAAYVSASQAPPIPQSIPRWQGTMSGLTRRNGACFAGSGNTTEAAAWPAQPGRKALVRATAAAPAALLSLRRYRVADLPDDEANRGGTIRPIAQSARADARLRVSVGMSGAPGTGGGIRARHPPPRVWRAAPIACPSAGDRSASWEFFKNSIRRGALVAWKERA